MNFNRRSKPRIVPDGFTFIQVERDDGGRILNVSEEGLCFEAFSAISVSESVHFWFSFNLRDRIEAVGRLVWMDAKKRVGGLSITEHTPAARAQIRAQFPAIATDVEVTSSEKTPPSAVSTESSPPSRPPVISIAPETVAPTANTPALQAAIAFGKPQPAVKAPAHPNGPTQLVPLERFLAATRSQFRRGLLLGALIPSIIAIPVFKYACHSNQSAVIREWPEQPGKGNPEIQAESQSSNCTQPPPPVPSISSTLSQAPRFKSSSYAPGNIVESVKSEAAQPR